jgi:hypothetical protein
MVCFIYIILSGNSCRADHLAPLREVFIKFVRLPPLIIQINSTYIYNALQSDLQNCIYGLFYLHYPLGQLLAEPTILHPCEGIYQVRLLAATRHTNKRNLYL